MNKQIKIIKRDVRNFPEVEGEKVSSSAGKNAEGASPLKLARTIEEWVRMHRQRAREELSIARSLRAAL